MVYFYANKIWSGEQVKQVSGDTITYLNSYLIRIY